MAVDCRAHVYPWRAKKIIEELPVNEAEREDILGQMRRGCLEAHTCLGTIVDTHHPREYGSLCAPLSYNSERSRYGPVL
jgi:hypothetical protein